MKKLFIICSLVLLVSYSFSQKGTYYLANDLRSLYNPATGKVRFNETVKAELEEYVYKDSNVTIAMLEKNPFLRNLFVEQAGSSTGSFVERTIGNVSGLDVTKLVNAISEIMIERAKQELTITFFNRFQKFATENNPEFQILFPKTTENLSNLLTYSYPQMLPALRAGFFEDLRKLTYHVDDVLELPKYRLLLENFPEVRVAVRSISLITDIEDGTSTIADVIRDFGNFKEWTEGHSKGFVNMGGAVRFASILSEGLRNDNDTSVWVPAKVAKKMIKDEIFVRIFMGLIYQQVKNADIKIYLDKEIPLTSLLEKQSRNIILFQNKLTEFLSLTDKVTESYHEVREVIAGDEQLNHEKVSSYINQSIEIADYAFSVLKIFNEKLIADSYLNIVKKANALYKDIYSEQYTQAIEDAIGLLKDVHSLTKQNSKTFILGNATSPLDIKKDSAIVVNSVFFGDVSAGFAPFNATTIRVSVPAHSSNEIRIKTSTDSIYIYGYFIDTTGIDHSTLNKSGLLDGLVSFLDKAKPYALFMANVVEADSEDEIKKALENVILPVGSSSIKKHTACNISVQTYLGAFYSFYNKSASINGTWSDKFGVTAPIGVSWTPKLFSWGEDGSLSLFASLLDLGAIVDYKLKEEPNPTSSDPDATILTKDYKIELGQIFSPGFHLVYGFFGNIPLSIGVGVQYGPGLSKIETDNSLKLRNPALRGSLFFAVDLPFFTLKNRPKKL